VASHGVVGLTQIQILFTVIVFSPAWKYMTDKGQTPAMIRYGQIAKTIEDGVLPRKFVELRDESRFDLLWQQEAIKQVFG
jgi:hypothetical protein